MNISLATINAIESAMRKLDSARQELRKVQRLHDLAMCLPDNPPDDDNVTQEAEFLSKAIDFLLEDREGGTWTTTELYNELEETRNLDRSVYPNVAHFGRALARLSPQLRRLGWDVHNKRVTTGSLWSFARAEELAADLYIET